MAPPRPELESLLGLPYRRIPVLALGRDVYADTSLIASALERHFPPTSASVHGQHTSLFPPRKGAAGKGSDAGLSKAFAQFYVDRVLFRVGFELLPWEKVPAAVREDRKKFIGRDFSYQEMAQRRSFHHSTLASHLSLLEEQLGDGREWFLDTTDPGLVDVSVYFFVAWVHTFRETRAVLDPAQYPHTHAWFRRMEDLLAQKRAAVPRVLTKITGTDAAREILFAPFLDLTYVGFDAVEAGRLGLRLGGRVAVCPDDSGKDVATIGKLVALNAREVVLETDPGTALGAARSGGCIRVHFPRLGYVIKEAKLTESKL